jgi:two-component sensor histidine kinase/ligand-binding sensor domain-containing protein
MRKFARNPNAGPFLVLLLFVAVFFCAFPLPAQQISLDLNHYGKASGLSDHRIRSVLLHSNGFVYLGTYNGFNRFDGYQCTEIPLPGHDCIQNVFPKNYVYTLTELGDGRIMILLDMPDLSSCEFFLYNPISGVFNSHKLDAFDEGWKWIETGGERLLLKNRVNRSGEGEAKVIYDLHDNSIVWNPDRVNPFAELRLKGRKPLDITYLLEDLVEVKPEPFGRDFSNSIFLTSHNGLFKIDVQLVEMQNYLSRDIEEWEYGLSARAIFKMSDGTLLIGTDFYELFIKQPQDRDFIPLQIENIETGQTELIGPVRGIHQQEDGAIILVLSSAAVLRYNYQKGSFSKVKAMSAPNVRVSSKFQCSTLLQDTILCISNYDKLILYDLKNEVIINTPLINEVLLEFGVYSSMIENFGDGTIWYGTVSGLFHLDPLQDRFLQFYTDSFTPLPKGLPSTIIHRTLPLPTVHDIYKESELIYILATDGAGVVELEITTGSTRNLTIEDGLSDNTVCTIEKGDAGYWLGTYNGLSHWNRMTGRFTNFYLENGLPHNEMNRHSSYADGKGNFFFGGMNGVCEFKEEELLGTRDSCQTLISQITYFDSKGKAEIENFGMSGSSNLEIPANNRSFSIKLALDDFYNATDHRYFFRLQNSGEEEMAEWQGLKRQSILRFEYLDAGDYTLELKGISAKGNPASPVRMNVVVHEFFYKTWWFISALILLAILIVYLVYRYRIEQVLKVERLKNQLSHDLHDDVGSVLSGVAYQMDLISYSVEDKHKNAVQRVAASSRKAMSQLRDVVWAVNTDSSRVQDLLERMKEFSSEQLEPLNIRCLYDSSGLSQQFKLSTEQRHALLLIFKEFLTNSIKHSGADTVQVLLSRADDFIVMELRDNGKGLSSEAQKKTGLGLKNMQKRVKNLKGDFFMDGKDGMFVLIKLPIR